MKPNDDNIAESSRITDKEDVDGTVSLSSDRKQGLNMTQKQMKATQHLHLITRHQYNFSPKFNL
jgi:hypothetical protein